MQSFKKFILENDFGEIKENQTFKNLTTIKCGGEIKYSFYPKDINSLAIVYRYINDNNLKHAIIGGGSNVIGTDKFFNGIVIVLKNMPYSYQLNKDVLTCSAFYPSNKLAYDMAIEKCGNLAFLGGIPGLIGGAIYNNAGSFGQEISDYLISTIVIDTSGSLLTINKNELDFKYRKSIFHDMNWIIVGATFKVKQNIETLAILNENARKRRESQPRNVPSIGSVFRNNPVYQAWHIVDKLGYRGYRKGDCAVSMKHANFIINLGNGLASDFIGIVESIRQKALKELGIILDVEICYIE